MSQTLVSVIIMKLNDWGKLAGSIFLVITGVWYLYTQVKYLKFGSFIIQKL